MTNDKHPLYQALDVAEEILNEFQYEIIQTIFIEIKRRINMLEIKVKTLSPICTPCRTKQGDWIDLKSAHDISLKAGEFAYIPLGVCMELPAGYEAHIIPRSSTFKRYGIIQTNSMGLIDNSYCGDNDWWVMPVYAVRDTFIPKGDRICQFRIVENQPESELKLVEKMNNNDRNGLGSTGTK